mgnify:CR=1 FL=1
MLLLALLARAAWPRDWRTWLHLGVAGILIHAIYLSGVFMAINQGLPAGIVSLVVGLQPLLTAMVAGLLLGESVRQRQWLGLILGLAGTVIVLSGRLRAGFDLAGLWPALAALLGISSGALYQKRFCPHFDWRSGAVIQFMAAALVMAWSSGAGAVPGDPSGVVADWRFEERRGASVLTDSSGFGRNGRIGAAVITGVRSGA